jgi:hypothetical protein
VQFRPHRVQTAVVTMVLTGAAVAAGEAPASADGSPGSFVAATSALRAEAGLPAYRTCADLDAIAQRWAGHMAATSTLAHNPDLVSDVPNWQSVGENVGEGPSDAGIEAALVASPPHLANLESRTFTEVGYGVAESHSGELWVDEVFRLPMSGDCAGASPPSTPVRALVAGSSHPVAAGMPVLMARRVDATSSMAAEVIRAQEGSSAAQAARAAQAGAAAAASAARQHATRLFTQRITIAGSSAGPLDVVASALAFAQLMRPVG